MYAKEPCVNAKEPYVNAKEPYVNAKEPYANAKDPYINAKEPYVNAKEFYANAKEPYVRHSLCRSEKDVFGWKNNTLIVAYLNNVCRQKSLIYKPKSPIYRYICNIYTSPV